MKVRRKENAPNSSDWKLLRVGFEYTVYGIELSTPPEFLVFEPAQFSFPFFVASEAVDVVDARLSKFWIFAPALPATDTCNYRAPLIAFDAFARDRRYYQALVDGEAFAVAAWSESRDLMDAEAEAQGVPE